VPECFCGCGRRAGFRERLANLAGEETDRLLRDAERLGAPSDRELGAVLDSGRTWREVWAAVVHGEISRAAVNRDSWVRWRADATDFIRRTTARQRTH